MTDTPSRIANPFPHLVAGIHIGTYRPAIVGGEFDAVLSVGREAGTAPEGVRHAHIHLPYGEMNTAALDNAVDWIRGQLSRDRTILIRSEKGKQRPALVAAMTVIRLGGSYFDATSCARRAGHDVLTDFRYLALLRHEDAAVNKRPIG